MDNEDSLSECFEEIPQNSASNNADGAEHVSPHNFLPEECDIEQPSHRYLKVVERGKGSRPSQCQRTVNSPLRKESQNSNKNHEERSFIIVLVV